eukprot:scaffold16000_cov19-Tisochrysis_lutea.AAC.1
MKWGVAHPSHKVQIISQPKEEMEQGRLLIPEYWLEGLNAAPAWCTCIGSCVFSPTAVAQEFVELLLG